jgi:hypothetical protein
MKFHAIVINNDRCKLSLLTNVERHVLNHDKYNKSSIKILYVKYQDNYHILTLQPICETIACYLKQTTYSTCTVIIKFKGIKILSKICNTMQFIPIKALISYCENHKQLT